MLPNVMPVENKDYLTAFDIFFFVLAIFWLVSVIFRTKSKLKVKIPEIGPPKKSHQVKKLAPGWNQSPGTQFNQKFKKLDYVKHFHVKPDLTIIPPDYMCTKCCCQRLCFLGFSYFSKKTWVLAARLGTRNFTRALGYAKHPLSVAHAFADARFCRRTLLQTLAFADARFGRRMLSQKHASAVICS